MDTRNICDLENQITGLNWDLVDAQMDANRLARMYIELCEAAAPWMDDISERKNGLIKFEQTDAEAVMRRPILRDQPRIRNENPQFFGNEEVVWDSVYPAPSAGGSVAIHLHLYYTDLADEFISFFQNIPFAFDLYISCQPNANMMEICKQFSVLELAQEIIVRKTLNRGRDISPLYVLFREEVAKHDFFLHVHSKKSLYTGAEQTEWRTGSLRKLCGSEMQVRKIFGVLQSQKNVGLLFPETTGSMPFWVNTWLSNGRHVGRLSKELGFSAEEDIFNYPVGSFFWARTDALRSVFDRAYSYEDFDEEHGQIDGMLAHVLERAIAFVARSKGYSLAIVDSEDNVVRFNSSQKILRNYYRETMASAKATLSQFDAVSFDIFDTLITRKLYNPDDLFYLMGESFEKKYGYHVDFIRYRKAAEEQANKKFGARTNIHNIYDELPDIMNISAQTAEELKCMEIELEMESSIPRQDMLELFNYLRRKCIPIYLVSDMYLPTDIVERLLAKCGYSGYSELYLSCELGLRKDSGTMWTYLVSIWRHKRVVHVGDNFCSDMQRPVDMHIPIYPILNPRTMFQLSDVHSYFQEKVRHEVASSYIMGMLVNGLLFNSPFAMESQHKLRKVKNKTAAKAMFGATLLSFLQAIPNYVKEDQELLFLAREGYFLKDLYELYFESSDRRKNPNCYFLASRRASSGAAIKSEEDIRTLLSGHYCGSVANLLRTRLGMDTRDKLSHCMVRMPEEIEDVMELIKDDIQALLERSKNECDAYNTYADAMIKSAKEVPPVVIDLGYSGTIQYYLTLALNRRIDGFYLFTEPNKKPEKVGCSCASLFSREGDFCGNAIMDNSLILESILQAPHGQVLHFVEDLTEKAGVRPVFRKEKLPPEEIFSMQKAVVEYALELAQFEKVAGHAIDLNPELAIHSFLAVIQSRMIPDEIMNIFSVEDFFCGNGVKRIDTISGKWINTKGTLC